MTIHKVTYIENGYFEVKYSQTNPVIQDIGGIKMTTPTDPAIKNILMFLRTLKLEKLQNKDTNDLKYRNQEIYSYKESIHGMAGYAAAHAIDKPDW